jgi:hypothetical protein
VVQAVQVVVVRIPLMVGRALQTKALLEVTIKAVEVALEKPGILMALEMVAMVLLLQLQVRQ